MGNGFGQFYKLAAFALVGVSGLLVSCAASINAPKSSTPASSAIPRVPADFASATRSQIHIEDDFDAPGLEQQFEAVARRATPAVVAISAIDTPLSSDDLQHPGLASPERLNAALDAVDRTVGTGFVIEADGLIAMQQAHSR